MQNNKNIIQDALYVALFKIQPDHPIHRALHLLLLVSACIYATMHDEAPCNRIHRSARLFTLRVCIIHAVTDDFLWGIRDCVDFCKVIKLLEGKRELKRKRREEGSDQLLRNGFTTRTLRCWSTDLSRYISFENKLSY